MEANRRPLEQQAANIEGADDTLAVSMQSDDSQEGHGSDRATDNFVEVRTTSGAMTQELRGALREGRLRTSPPFGVQQLPENEGGANTYQAESPGTLVAPLRARRATPHAMCLPLVTSLSNDDNSIESAAGSYPIDGDGGWGSLDRERKNET
jgi:hypothetical protein